MVSTIQRICEQQLHTPKPEDGCGSRERGLLAEIWATQIEYKRKSRLGIEFGSGNTSIQRRCSPAGGKKERRRERLRQLQNNSTPEAPTRFFTS
jgi:hypothetical protein